MHKGGQVALDGVLIGGEIELWIEPGIGCAVLEDAIGKVMHQGVDVILGNIGIPGKIEAPVKKFLNAGAVRRNQFGNRKGSHAGKGILIIASRRDQVSVDGRALRILMSPI